MKVYTRRTGTVAKYDRLARRIRALPAARTRIDEALFVAFSYLDDGEHDPLWVCDAMIRSLAGDCYPDWQRLHGDATKNESPAFNDAAHDDAKRNGKDEAL